MNLLYLLKILLLEALDYDTNAVTRSTRPSVTKKKKKQGLQIQTEKRKNEGKKIKKEKKRKWETKRNLLYMVVIFFFLILFLIFFI